MTFWNVISYHNRSKADEKSCKRFCWKGFYTQYRNIIHMLNFYVTTPSQRDTKTIIGQIAYFGPYCAQPESRRFPMRRIASQFIQRCRGNEGEEKELRLFWFALASLNEGLSVHWSVHWSVGPSVRPSVVPSSHLSVCPSVSPSVRPPVGLSVWPSVMRFFHFAKTLVFTFWDS